MSLKTAITDHIPGYNKMVLPLHFVRAILAGVRYGWPARKLTVIGVTGTNGKTSTCFMIWKMLNEAGYKTGVMTTVGWGVEKITPQIEHMTTESVGVLNKRMRKIADEGAEFLVLEVTSHALSQFRILGVPIEVAVETNVTHEHLDYHKTFENYRDAKRKLFERAKFGVINADDKSAAYFISSILPAKYARKSQVDGFKAKKMREFSDESKYYMTYGVKRGILRAQNVELGATGVEYDCAEGLSVVRSEKATGVTDGSRYEVSKIHIETQIPGTFTVYNTLAAVAVGLRLGLSETEISSGLKALESVEGRMNRVVCGQDFEVIVDYAHTPDALAKVFESVAGHKGRVISVHGGAGRRDESTRAERGEILARGSDVVIVTEDDSRDENPEKIAKMFVQGCERIGKKMNKDLFVELNREKAIRKACEMAEEGDLVLILGKGHEKTILRKDGAHEFEDLKVAEKVLKGLVGK